MKDSVMVGISDVKDSVIVISDVKDSVVDDISDVKDSVVAVAGISDVSGITVVSSDMETSVFVEDLAFVVVVIVVVKSVVAVLFHSAVTFIDKSDVKDSVVVGASDVMDFSSVERDTVSAEYIDPVVLLSCHCVVPFIVTVGTDMVDPGVTYAKSETVYIDDIVYIVG